MLSRNATNRRNRRATKLFAKIATMWASKTTEVNHRSRNVEFLTSGAVSNHLLDQRSILFGTRFSLAKYRDSDREDSSIQIRFYIRFSPSYRRKPIDPVSRAPTTEYCFFLF